MSALAHAAAVLLGAVIGACLVAALVRRPDTSPDWGLGLLHPRGTK